MREHRFLGPFRRDERLPGRKMLGAMKVAVRSFDPANTHRNPPSSPKLGADGTVDAAAALRIAAGSSPRN
jgi:hypothetical protein